MLKIWNVVLIIITYGLTIIGTFLTRSGVVNSVHSFTQSEIGPAFLVFLAVVLVVGFALLFRRIQMLNPNTRWKPCSAVKTPFLLRTLSL